jgi:hypothetical protein
MGTISFLIASSIIHSFTEYYWYDQSQGRWDGRASSTHGMEEKCIQNFSMIFMKWDWEAVDWIHLAQDKN